MIILIPIKDIIIIIQEWKVRIVEMFEKDDFLSLDGNENEKMEKKNAKEDIILKMVKRREIINSRFRLKIILKGISDDDGI